MNKEKQYPVTNEEIAPLMAHVNNYAALSAILAGYDLPTLIEIAAALYDWPGLRMIYRDCQLKSLLKKVMNERARRLDAEFEWTEQNKERFLSISEQLYEACAAGWQEAETEAAALHFRANQNDAFLGDYEIEMTICAYPLVGDERESIESVRCYLAEENQYKCPCFSLANYKQRKMERRRHPPIDIDWETNWNIEYFGGVFENDYICYLVHYLLDTGAWSFADILSVYQIWTDVEITHQRLRVISAKSREAIKTLDYFPTENSLS